MAKFEVGKTYLTKNQTVKILDKTEKSLKIQFNNKIFRRKIQLLNEGYDSEIEYFYIENCDQYAIMAKDEVN